MNPKLLNDLQVDSEILDLIQDDFLRVLHESNIRVHSFQEGEGLAGVRGFSEHTEFSRGRITFQTDELSRSLTISLQRWAMLWKRRR